MYLRQVIFLIFIFLLALPVAGAWVDTTPLDTTRQELQLEFPNKFITGICYLVVDWDTATCDGEFSAACGSKSWVDMSVCDQAQADAGTLVKDTQTQNCIQSRVDTGVCQASWLGTPLDFTHATCKKVANHWFRWIGKSAGQNGLKIGDATRNPAPSDNTGDVIDP